MCLINICKSPVEILLILGIFIYVVFSALSKAPLLAKGNPFIKESEHFHYSNLRFFKKIIMADFQINLTQKQQRTHDLT